MDKFLNMKINDPKGFFESTKQIIEDMTVITNEHVLTPELTLRVKSINNPTNIKAEENPVPDPYWAYNWVGGQALTRYVLDNPEIIRSKSILDVGSGCGALSIAAAKIGTATSITANDIDPIASVAVELNASLNSCQPNAITTLTENLIDSQELIYLKYDTIFLGDMYFYEKKNVDLLYWLVEQAVDKRLEVYFGDPVRDFMAMYLYRKHFRKIKVYKLSDEDRDRNGLDHNYIYVYKMVPLSTKKKKDPFPNRLNEATGLCNLAD